MQVLNTHYHFPDHLKLYFLKLKKTKCQTGILMSKITFKE